MISWLHLPIHSRHYDVWQMAANLQKESCIKSECLWMHREVEELQRSLCREMTYNGKLAISHLIYKTVGGAWQNPYFTWEPWNDNVPSTVLVVKLSVGHVNRKMFWKRERNIKHEAITQCAMVVDITITSRQTCERLQLFPLTVDSANGTVVSKNTGATVCPDSKGSNLLIPYPQDRDLCVCLRVTANSYRRLEN